MGNIPLHFSCLCPNKDNKIEDKIRELEDNNIRYIENINSNVNSLEMKMNVAMNKLEAKIDRIEDKIDIKFEMLFLNMKIKN